MNTCHTPGWVICFFNMVALNFLHVKCSSNRTVEINAFNSRSSALRTITGDKYYPGNHFKKSYSGLQVFRNLQPFIDSNVIKPHEPTDYGSPFLQFHFKRTPYGAHHQINSPNAHYMLISREIILLKVKIFVVCRTYHAPCRDEGAVTQHEK